MRGVLYTNDATKEVPNNFPIGILIADDIIPKGKLLPSEGGGGGVYKAMSCSVYINININI